MQTNFIVCALTAVAVAQSSKKNAEVSYYNANSYGDRGFMHDLHFRVGNNGMDNTLTVKQVLVQAGDCAEKGAVVQQWLQFEG